MADELKPSTFYMVYGKPQLDQSEQDALLYLYQPMIGSSALSLYLTLVSDITLEGKSPSLMHTDLLAAIDTGLMNLIKAREQLEGIGLLESYQKNDSELGLSLIYQLRNPLLPEKFFQDPLMAYLLMDKVGKRRYERLVQRFKPKSFDKGTAKNITKRFREVYRLDERAFASQSEILEKTQEEFADKSDFDWSLFTQQLKRFNLILSVEEREKLKTFQTLYGLNELDLAEYAAKAAAGENSGLNFTYLRQLINKEKRPKTVAAPPVDVVPKNAPVNADFSAQEGEIIEQSKKIAPVTFLRAIKREKGGFETNTEVRLLEELIGRNLIPKSVINIIINYILVIQNQAVINANYLNAIANDWAQKKINTPEAAIAHVRENNQKLVRKPQTSRPSYQKRGGRKELLPEHIKQPPKETKLSPEKEAELNRKLAEYLSKEGDD